MASAMYTCLGSSMKSRIFVQSLLIVVESAVCRNLPEFASSSAQDADKVYTPYFDAEGNPTNGPPVVTFQVSDGTQVDCVPVEQQISAHLPSLKGRPVQLKAQLPQLQSEAAECQQLFRLEHGSCPDGTIAIQRGLKQGNATQREFAHRLLAESKRSTFHGVPFFVPETNTSSGDTVSTLLAPDLVEPGPFNAAEAELLWEGIDPTTFGGFGATLSVQQQHIETGPESLSSSFINFARTYWQGLNNVPPIFAGSGQLVAGFLANPSYYGDSLPRFYTFWNVAVVTPIQAKKGGCFNMLCPGYTHVSQSLALGATLTPGTEISLYIKLDYAARQYNLFSGAELVGFWLHDETIGWNEQNFNTNYDLWPTPFVLAGGHVSPFFYGDRVTTTHMGTGKFASEAGAAYMRNIVHGSTVDNVLYPVPTAGLQMATTHGSVPPRCYSAYIGSGDRVDWGTYVLYGGRGGENPTCRPGV